MGGVKKSLMLSFLSALAKILGGIGLLMVLARVFSLGAFGNFTYALTIGTVFSFIVDYGYNIKIIKDISTKGGDTSKIVSTTLFSKLLLLFFTTAILTGVLVFSKASKELITTQVFLFIGLILFSFTNTFLSVFKGKKQYDKDLKIVLIDNISTFVLVSTIAVLTGNIAYTAMSFAASKILAPLFSLREFKKQDSILIPERRLIKKDLYTALPYAVHYWVGSLYLNVDTIIMKPFVTEDQLGIYQSGIRIVLGIGIVLTVINSVYLPLLNNLLHKSENEFRRDTLKLTRDILRLSVLAIAGMILFAKPIILVLFGKKFLELQDIFWVFAIIIGIRIIGASYGILLTISNKQNLRAVAGAISISLIILFNYLLIPEQGYKVAAYILLFAHLFITTFYIVSIYFEYKSIFAPSIKEIFGINKIT